MAESNGTPALAEALASNNSQPSWAIEGMAPP